MIGFPWRLYSHTIFLWWGEKQTSNTKYLELIKRRPKFQEKNMSCERVLNFHQWKTFSENYKPMRVWLWLVYRFTENCQIYRLFSEFIQTQKTYPTSLDKICILTWKLLVISSKNFSGELKTPKELTPCKISHICRCTFKNLLPCKFLLMVSTAFCWVEIFDCKEPS